MIVQILYVDIETMDNPLRELHKAEIKAEHLEMFITPPGMYILAIQVVWTGE
jgi:hypothetical protein